MSYATLQRAVAFLVLLLPVAPARAQDPRVLPLPIRTRGTALAATGPVAAIATGDTFPLVLRASVEFSHAGGMAFGDTDHDGANELAFQGSSLSYRIWEHQGGDEYSLVGSDGSDLLTYAIADADRDGRSEIIGQYSGYVRVFESVDAASHPSQLVWSSPYLSNIGGNTTVGDTDRDGRMEIVHSVNYSSPASYVAIFECTGDNSYSLVFQGSVSSATASGEKLIADLDGDGKLEIATCGSPGWLYVFESPADDAWVRTAREWTGLHNAWVIDGGSDTDGNGRPEIFVSGNLFTTTTDYFTTAIYESCADDSFVQVATLVMDEGVGSGPASVCNVDGVGREEYLTASGPGIYVFRSGGIGSWTQVGIVYGPGGGPHAFDLDGDGLPEVIRRVSTTTRILEYPGIPTGSGGGTTRPAVSLDVVPNPCRVEAALRYAARGEMASTLAVFDVSGRLVGRRPVDGSRSPVLWRPEGISAGVYVLRLESSSGKVVASGRGTIIR